MAGSIIRADETNIVAEINRIILEIDPDAELLPLKRFNDNTDVFLALCQLGIVINNAIGSGGGGGADIEGDPNRLAIFAANNAIRDLETLLVQTIGDTTFFTFPNSNSVNFQTGGANDRFKIADDSFLFNIGGGNNLRLFANTAGTSRTLNVILDSSSGNVFTLRRNNSGQLNARTEIELNGGGEPIIYRLRSANDASHDIMESNGTGATTFNGRINSTNRAQIIIDNSGNDTASPSESLLSTLPHLWLKDRVTPDPGDLRQGMIFNDDTTERLCTVENSEKIALVQSSILSFGDRDFTGVNTILTPFGGGGQLFWASPSDYYIKSLTLMATDSVGGTTQEVDIRSIELNGVNGIASNITASSGTSLGVYSFVTGGSPGGLANHAIQKYDNLFLELDALQALIIVANPSGFGQNDYQVSLEILSR